MKNKRNLKLAVLMTFYVHITTTTTTTTTWPTRTTEPGASGGGGGGRARPDIDATLRIIIPFVCGSRVLTSSQLPDKGCSNLLI